jgi:hypothetical protein
MEALEKEVSVAVKRQRILAQSTLNCIDELIEFAKDCRTRCGSPTRSESRNTEDGGGIKHFATQVKEEADRYCQSFFASLIPPELVLSTKISLHLSRKLENLLTKSIYDAWAYCRYSPAMSQKLSIQTLSR